MYRQQLTRLRSDIADMQVRVVGVSMVIHAMLLLIRLLTKTICNIKPRITSSITAYENAPNETHSQVNGNYMSMSDSEAIVSSSHCAMQLLCLPWTCTLGENCYNCREQMTLYSNETEPTHVLQWVNTNVKMNNRCLRKTLLCVVCDTFITNDDAPLVSLPYANIATLFITALAKSQY